MSIFSLVKPFIFSIEPERAHDMAISALELGVVKQCAVKPASELSQNLFGINFPHPLGMAAGFDKNARVFKSLFKLGFSFAEIGTITPIPQTGNPKPRIFRLIKDEAIINRMGFNNDGHEEAFRRIKNYEENKSTQQNNDGILGVNLGANKDTENKIEDYKKGILKFAHHADFITINISSPNTPGLRLLQKKEALRELIEGILQARDNSRNKNVSILIKIAPDLDYEELKSIAALSLEYNINGIIISNTSLSRKDLQEKDQATEQGGLSGKPIFNLSNKVLAQFYLLTYGKIPIIGVGGISSPEDALTKIEAGASLVEIYTSFIYQGPVLINDIIKQLPNLLISKGYPNISAAIGKNAKNLSEINI